MRTDNEIKTALYKAIKQSPLADAINGEICKRERPRGSDKEDVVISILTNQGCGQIQRVYVNVNVYIKDLYNSKNKSYEVDDARVGELSALCEFLYYLHDDWYHVIASQCSQQCFDAGATFEDGRSEHFINNKILIEIINEKI